MWGVREREEEAGTLVLWNPGPECISDGSQVTTSSSPPQRMLLQQLCSLLAKSLYIWDLHFDLIQLTLKALHHVNSYSSTVCLQFP